MAQCLCAEGGHGPGGPEIRRTPQFARKTGESQRTVDLAPGILDGVRGFMKGSESAFVLDGGEATPAATYGYSQADCTWRDLPAWLKGKGVTQQKTIHALRKEADSSVGNVPTQRGFGSD